MSESKKPLPRDVFETIDSWDNRRLSMLAEWLVVLCKLRDLEHATNAQRAAYAESTRRLATSFEEGDLREELRAKTLEELQAEDDLLRRLKKHHDARHGNGAAE